MRAWVAGGSGSLGGAVVQELAQQGWQGIATGRRAEAPLLPEGWQYAAVEAGGWERVRDFAEQLARTGPWQGLVVTIGAFALSPLETRAPDPLGELLEANVTAVWNVARAAAPLLQEGGSMVLTAAWSALARPPAPGQAAYRAAKTALVSLCESLAEAWADRGVRVNALAPSILDTPENRSAMGGRKSDWVSTADAARVVAFLLSDASRAVTGAVLPLRYPRGSAG